MKGKVVFYPRQFSGGTVVLMSVVLFGAFLLKKYYSQADSDSLFWILGPTAFIVELVTGISFFNEPGFGWVNQMHSVVIAPACSGVNFMIILYCMCSFRILFSGLSTAEILAGIIMAVGFSYCATLLVNGLRVWLSIWLYQADFYLEWLSRDDLHRIAGIAVYYLFLCFYDLFVSAMLNQRLGVHYWRKNGFSKIQSSLILAIPLCWYLLFSIGVPFINKGYTEYSQPFIKHSLTVFGMSTLLTVILTILTLVYHGVSRCVRRRLVR